MRWLGYYVVLLAFKERNGDTSWRPGSYIPKKKGAHLLTLLSSSLPFPVYLLLSSKASKSRHLKRGVKEVVKSVRKGEKGCVPPPLPPPSATMH